MGNCFEFNWWGLVHFPNKIVRRWYQDFTGVQIFGKKFIGFSFSIGERVVDIQSRPFGTMAYRVLWVYVLFFHFSIDYSGLVNKFRKR